MMLKTLIGAAMGCTVLAGLAGAQTDAGRERSDGGKQVYERANCVGCHKWSGVGGGGYGGAALSLRATELSHDQIVEIVTCGRPGTGMPHFTPDPYQDGSCYGLKANDVKANDVKDMMPPGANVALRPNEIDEVANYVAVAIKGRGEPTLADCVAFFGDASRVCDVYRPKTEAGNASRHVMPTPTTTAR